MNKLTIIGNLVRDPELRTTSSGVNACSFTVAVNRRKKSDSQPEADFFRVTAWRGLADVCYNYLAKGRKVAVVGSVSVSVYTANDGTARASMEVNADDVEFLNAKNETATAPQSVPNTPVGVEAPAAPDNGFTEVEDEDLPF